MVAVVAAVGRQIECDGEALLPAGQIAAQVGVPASTMSTHLAQLERAGLLRSWREQHRILYAVETEGIRQLFVFLTERCLYGRPGPRGGDGTPPVIKAPKAK